MVTLDRLVNVLGSYGVRLRSCPIPRSTELRSVVMPEVAWIARLSVTCCSVSVPAQSQKPALGGRGARGSRADPRRQ